MAIADIGPTSSFVAATPGTKQSRPRGLYVGTAGDVSVKNEAGDTVVFKGVAAGAVLPIAATEINSAGTTAGDIVLLY